MSQLNFLAVLILDLGKFHVRIVDHTKDILWRLRQVTDLCKKCFLCFGEDMGLLAFDLLQREFIVSQGRVFYEAFQFLFRQGQDLRCDIREGFADFHTELLSLLDQSLICRVRGIFIMMKMRKYEQTLNLERDFILQDKGCFDILSCI
ncbi:hypothetical protein D3C81_1398880 [compost metagenome]